jgi:O-antigen ligase
MSASGRLVLYAILGVAVGFAIIIPILLPDLGISHILSGLWRAMASAFATNRDPDTQFRFLRWAAVLDLWQRHWLFGAGFGEPLIPSFMIPADEAGKFNSGLPHNSFLTVLARMGVFGLILVAGAWILGIVAAHRAARRSAFPADAVAAGAVLITMAGFAFFVLFLERPMHSASLWIVVAIAQRLAHPEPGGRAPAAARQALDGGHSLIRHARRVALRRG